MEHYPDPAGEPWDYYSRAAATHVIGRLGDEKFERFVAVNSESLAEVYRNAHFVVYRLPWPVDDGRRR